MSEINQQSKSGLNVVHSTLGLPISPNPGIKISARAGDTLNVKAFGNFAIRLLGIDVPEISLILPGQSQFTELSDSKWQAFLNNPFAADLPAFNPPLLPELLFYLQKRLGVNLALNQHQYGLAAEHALEQEILSDAALSGQSMTDFQFFLAFAHEIMDQRGRLLCFANRLQALSAKPEARPLSYNERLLKLAKVKPYFIWPNINPFRKHPRVVDAVPVPGMAGLVASQDRSFQLACEWVQSARGQKTGIFDAVTPLLLEPFEMRYLAERSPPRRWVIDLSQSDNLLVRPQAYYTIPKPEDRLYIAEEYVPLFVEAGWQRQL